MRKRQRGGRRSRFNSGKIFKGIGDGLSPKKMVATLPVLGGVILDGLATKFLGSKIPYTSRGIGAIGLGIVNAGLIGMLAKLTTKSAKLGDGLFIGGIVGTLGCAFQGLMTEGVRSLALSGWSDTMHVGFEGLGTFVGPSNTASAFTMDSNISSYGRPDTNAQFMPSAQLQAPHTPAQHHQVQGMSDNDSAAIGAVLGQVGNDDTQMAF